MIKILLLVSVTAFGQSISLTGPASAAPGSAIAISVNYTAQPVAIATNGANTLQASLTCSTNAAGNDMRIRQFIVEEIN